MVERSAIVEIAEAEGATLERSHDLVAIDDAFRALAEHDPRKAQIVELRFFGGLNLEEIAEVIGRRADHGQPRVGEGACVAAPGDRGRAPRSSPRR